MDVLYQPQQKYSYHAVCHFYSNHTFFQNEIHENRKYLRKLKIENQCSTTKSEKQTINNFLYNPNLVTIT